MIRAIPRNAGAVAVAFALTGIAVVGNSRETGRAALPVEGTAPGFDGAATSLYLAPLTNAKLRGKAVLLDFWTYSFINCISTMPYVRACAQNMASRAWPWSACTRRSFASKRTSPTSTQPSDASTSIFPWQSTAVNRSDMGGATATGRLLPDRCERSHSLSSVWRRRLRADGTGHPVAAGRDPRRAVGGSRSGRPDTWRLANSA